MRCEYCDTILEDGLTGTCPHCGGQLPEMPAAGEPFRASGGLPDMEKLRQLQRSGCRYCPHCLSTNVTKGRFLPPGVFLVLSVIFYVLIAVLSVAMPWLLVIGALVLLVRILVARELTCADCKLHWLPYQSKIYEKYRLHLYHTLGGRHEVKCPGINGRQIRMTIDRLYIGDAHKRAMVMYDQLTDVALKEPAGDLFGMLTVRTPSSAREPMPMTAQAAVNDPQTILYEPQYAEYYRIIYKTLRGIADDNRK